MSAPRKSAIRTRERILRAAERCFTSHGYDGTSLRQITRSAGVNLAAVNYHFSSKRELWLEMMQGRLAPLNAERMRRIEALRAATPAGQPLSVEKVCEAVFLPIAAITRNNPAMGQLWARLVSSTLSAPSSLTKELNRRSVGQFWRLYHAALRDALPGTPSQDLDWKFHFFTAAMIGTLALQGRQPGLAHPPNNGDLETQMRRLCAFVSSGLRASAGKK